MKTYDTTILEAMNPTDTVGMTSASKLTGLAASEITRMVKLGKLEIIKRPGKAKPEIVVRDLLSLLYWKNKKKNIGLIRKMRKEAKTGVRKGKREQSQDAGRVVIGVFDEAISRKPAFLKIPESADTIGDLITVAEASAKVEKDNQRALEIQIWVEWMESL